MALTRITTDNPNTAKIWSKLLSIEIANNTDIAPLIGKDSNHIIQLQDQASKQAGDAITFSLASKLVGSATGEGKILQGNEEAMRLLTDRLVINQMRHAVRLPNDGNIDLQRLAFDLNSTAKRQIINWFSERLSIMAFAHFCGYTAKQMFYDGRHILLSEADLGNNPVTPPASENIIRANKKATDQALTAEDSFNLSLIDEAVLRAKELKISPVRINGGSYYVMYLHPAQVMAMRTDTNKGQWLDLQKHANSANSQNPIFTGALGLYNGVILRESRNITNGIDSTKNTPVANTRRAVLLGAQAGILGYGKINGGGRYKPITELYDYENEIGLAISTLIGFKKTIYRPAHNEYTPNDYGVIVVSTYAASK